MTVGNQRWRRYEPPATDDVRREDRTTTADPVEPAEARAAAEPSIPGPSIPGPSIPGPSIPGPPAARPRPRRRRQTLSTVVAALVGAGLAGGYVLIQNGDERPPLEAIDYTPLVADGDLDRVADALEKETGSTQVVELYLSRGTQRDLRVTLPPSEETGLSDRYRWDGTTLELADSTTPPVDAEPFDLRDADEDVLVAVDREAWKRSGDDIAHSFVFVDPPAYDGDSWVSVHVGEADHGRYTLWADLAGNVERTYAADADE